MRHFSIEDLKFEAVPRPPSCQWIKVQEIMYERVGLPPLIDSILEPNFVAMLSTLSSNLIVTFDVENLSHPCTLKVVGRSTLAELCSYSAHFKYMFNFFACSRYRSHTLIERMFEFFLWSNEPVVHVESIPQRFGEAPQVVFIVLVNTWKRCLGWLLLLSSSDINYVTSGFLHYATEGFSSNSFRCGKTCTLAYYVVKISHLLLNLALVIIVPKFHMAIPTLISLPNEAQARCIFHSQTLLPFYIIVARQNWPPY